MKKLILLLFVFSLSLSRAQNVPMYSVSPSSDLLYVYDTLTWTPSSTVLNLTSSTGTVDGCNGLAVQPCTGEIYVAYKSGTSRYLGTLDTASGFITEIGDMGDKVANICFGAQNRLYAVTGDGATTSETLFEVSLVDGSMTLKTALGNGDDGEAIAFCSDNGKVYHWSGLSTSIMERVDTTTNAVTPITISGYIFSEISGATYIGNGQFLIAEFSDLILVDTNGVATYIGFGDEAIKGMAFPSRYIENQSAVIICPNDTAVFIATSGTAYSWFLDGNPLGLTTQSIDVSAPGDYSCEITIQTCTNTSNVLNLQNYALPIVVITPGPTALLCPTDVSVTLTGSSGGTSQWYFNGALIAGATTNTYDATAAGVYNMTKTNSNGCVDSAAVGTTVVYDPCGVGLGESTISLTVYPNPVDQNLVVQINNWNQNEMVQIEIISVQGQVVMSETYNGSTSYQKDVSSLESGVYIIQLSTDTEKILYRFVKK